MSQVLDDKRPTCIWLIQSADLPKMCTIPHKSNYRNRAGNPSRIEIGSSRHSGVLGVGAASGGVAFLRRPRGLGPSGGKPRLVEAEATQSGWPRGRLVRTEARTAFSPSSAIGPTTLMRRAVRREAPEPPRASNTNFLDGFRFLRHRLRPVPSPSLEVGLPTKWGTWGLPGCRSRRTWTEWLGPMLRWG
jgi:hypothetical protein